MFQIKHATDGYFEADFAGWSYQKDQKQAYKFKTKNEAQNCIDGLLLQQVEILEINKEIK